VDEHAFSLAERQAVYPVIAERLATAQALGSRSEEILALKVEGILECAELFVVALGEGRSSHVFGHRTLPQMALALDPASVSCAIQNPWLAARAEGPGLGLVSMNGPSGGRWPSSCRRTGGQRRPARS
jgi:5,6-dimethylbenzimidazole synthase